MLHKLLNVLCKKYIKHMNSNIQCMKQYKQFIKLVMISHLQHYL